MVQSKFFDIGLTLTIILVAVSTMFTFVNTFNHTGVLPDAGYSKQAIENKVESLQLQQSGEPGDIKTGIFFIDAPANAIAGVANTVNTGLGYIGGVVNGLLNFGQIIFSMFTGWAVIIYAILTPFGLQVLGHVFVSILGTIEFITLFLLVSDIIIGLAGRFG